MSYEELDKWVDTNAPNLNKRILHTQVASITGGEPGEDGLIVIEVEPGLEVGEPPFIPNGANVTTLITSGTPVVFYMPGDDQTAYGYMYPGMLLGGTNLYLLGATPSSVKMYGFVYDSEADIWEMTSGGSSQQTGIMSVAIGAGNKLNKTFGDIASAPSNGRPVITLLYTDPIDYSVGIYFLSKIKSVKSDADGELIFSSGSNTLIFTATSYDAKPVLMSATVSGGGNTNIST